MKGLILDTSTEKSLLILSSGKDLLLVKELQGGPALSQSLIQEVALCLKNPIDYIAIGIGPGSYTGIRVGAAFAKTYSYALKLPLVTFCSLEAYFLEEPSISLFSAKSQGVYALEKGSLPKLLSLDEAKKLSLPLVSPHEELKVQLPNLLIQDPNPKLLAEICYERMQRGETVAPEKLKLLYLGGPLEE